MLPGQLWGSGSWVEVGVAAVVEPPEDALPSKHPSMACCDGMVVLVMMVVLVAMVGVCLFFVLLIYSDN